MRFFAYACLALVLAGAPFPRAAGADETLFAVCQPRTARGEAAGLQIETYAPSSHWQRGDVLPLPGAHLIEPVQLLLGQRLGIAIAQGHSGDARDGSDLWNEAVLFGTNPLRRWPVPRELGWEPVQILCAPETGGDQQRLAIFDRRKDGAGSRVRFIELSISVNGPFWKPIAAWNVSGEVAAGAADWPRNRLFILSESARPGAAELTRIDTVERSATKADIAFAADASPQLNTQPAALAVEPQGGAVWLLGSGYSLNRGDGARVSWVQRVDANSLGPIGAPKDLPGGAAALLVANDQVWATTYDDATGFAYAAALGLKDDVLSVQTEESFRAAARAPLWARTFDGGDLALAGGRALRIFARRAAAVNASLEQPVESIAWTSSALYAGEGARLLRLDPQSAQIADTGPIAGGFVIDLVPSTIPFRANSDHGQLPPPRIELDANAEGRDRCVVPVPLQPGERARIELSVRAGNWLRADVAAPADGEARITFSVNTSSLRARDAAVSGTATLIIEADGKPVRSSLIDVVASATSPGARAIEWQLDEPAASKYPQLSRILAGPPLHLSERSRRGPFARPPRDDCAAVVRLEDVQRGVITRQVLLDYVTGGGGLLVIAGHSSEPVGDGLRRWLEPLGLLIDPSQEVAGRFPMPTSPLLDLGLDQLAVSAGAYMETIRPMDLVVPGASPGSASLALTRYGYGRLAVIASDSPFTDRALAQGAGKQFARALFGWLAGVNTVARDSDLDGLRDDLEDSNGNGVADSGETDWLRRDSDRDGVPDGAEDLNLNGIVDEGESNPRLPDSDGDGAPDGSDAEPLPRAGTPVLLAAQPATAPGEGGAPIELTGRNLPANPQVWFGEQRAGHVIRLDSTRLIAMPPPLLYRMDPGPMPVRIAHPLSGAETTLDHAFTYTATSQVRMVLETIERARRAYDGYRGRMALSVDLGEVAVESAAFFIQCSPRLMGMTVEFEPAPALVETGRTLSLKSYGGGQYRAELSPGDPITGHVALGTLHWREAEIPAPAEAVNWMVYAPDFRVPWGGGVKVSANELTEDLRGAAPEPPPNPAPTSP